MDERHSSIYERLQFDADSKNNADPVDLNIRYLMLDWARLSLKSLLASWEEWNLLSVILVFWCCYCFGPPLGFIWKKNYNINYVLYHFNLLWGNTAL